MLVLEREVGQTIQIGDDIRIMLVRANGNGRARIGIIAPDHIAISRTELLEPGQHTGTESGPGASDDRAAGVV